MESSSRFSQWMASITDFLEGQEWYQQLKAKWEELDPQSRLYLQIAGAASVVLVILLVMLSALWSVHKTRQELMDKNDLLNLISSANDEMRRLRESSMGAASTDTTPWPAYIQGLAAQAGIADPASLVVGPEKAGNATDTAKESLYDVALKHVSIKNIVRMAFALDSGARPAKVRNITIDTKADPAGWMDATLSISAFSMTTK